MINKDIAKKIIEEYKRPWKLFSLFIGLAILICGSIYFQAPDWDIPICFIMAFFTYLTASWCMHVIVEWQWKKFPLMAFYAWFSIDGCYWLYWHYLNPDVLVYSREIFRQKSSTEIFDTRNLENLKYLCFSKIYWSWRKIMSLIEYLANFERKVCGFSVFSNFRA